MKKWRNYWHRTGIVVIIFINLLVTGSASLMAYKIVDSLLPPIIYLLWASYFLVLLTLMISHKKKNIQKAILNSMILVLIALPLSGIGIPLSLTLSTSSFDIFKGNAFILVSLVFILGLLIRHENWKIKEAITKLVNYVMEIQKSGFKSSFAKYIISELSIFVILVLAIHLYLSAG